LIGKQLIVVAEGLKLIASSLLGVFWRVLRDLIPIWIQR